ncbi:hypothetical protein AWB73_00081 [Caballeronia turbans]|nr:hypothetical protein AWB73_00081 [Caballeronia turbans]
MKEHFKKWFNSLPAGDHPKDGEEWAWEGWQAALESRVLAERKPVGWAIREKHFPDKLVFSDETGEEPSEYDRKWLAQQGHEYVPLFTHPTPDDAKTREAFERALKQTYEMVDPLNPPVPGSYARGEHNGIIAALKTVRANFDAAIDRARQSGEEQP